VENKRERRVKTVKNMLNSMCLRCTCLGMDCNGTKNQLWNGCIYKEPLVKGNSLADLKNALVRLEVLEENAGKADEEYEAASEEAEKNSLKKLWSMV